MFTLHMENQIHRPLSIEKKTTYMEDGNVPQSLKQRLARKQDLSNV